MTSEEDDTPNRDLMCHGTGILGGGHSIREERKGMWGVTMRWETGESSDWGVKS